MDIRIITLDFDGVVLESTEIKTAAFRELFSAYPDKIEAIVRYHKEHEGISRYIKFKYAYEHVLHKTYSEDIEKQLGGRFREIVLEKVKRCPFTKGALEFIREHHVEYPVYIISGTPDEELDEIVTVKGIRGYCKRILGSSRQKSEWLDYIIMQENIEPDRLLFIGDSLSDYRAAVEKKFFFVGRIQPGGKNIFPEENTRMVINDLTELSLPLNREERGRKNTPAF